MTQEIKAYAATKPGGPLEPYSYNPGPLGPEEVEIKVTHCGLCHSDLSMLDNEWGMTKYPFVPGHEAIGTVVALGEGAKGLKVGQRVGLGWWAYSCLSCPQCLSGDHHLCPNVQGTIVGHHGAFAERVRAQWTWVRPLPDALDYAKAGPLFCGGVTVFTPLLVHDVPPTARVGIIGIGGLGHMALQFANKWGCEVHAFTTSDGKEAEMRQLNGFNNKEMKGVLSMDAMKTLDEFNYNRRHFLRNAAMAVAATRFASLGFADEPISAPGTTMNPPAHTTFASLKQIDAGVLSVGYAEDGPADGPVVILLHGWPYDIYSFVDVAPLLAAQGYRVIVPYVRGYGSTRFLSDDTLRNGQPSAVALDTIALMDALGIKKAIIGGFDWGARSADIIAALWPERCKALVSVSGYLIGSQEAGRKPLPPAAEYLWWYQYYFATDRGRDGYDKYRRDFSKLIWKLASPQWSFSDATFERSAAAFDNPDYVAIVIHNYRWRLDLAQGEPQYDKWEALLAKAPDINVPAITMEGDANGAPHPGASAYAKKFTGRYAHRLITGGIGHNLPQEAPQAFAAAVMEVDSY